MQIKKSGRQTAFHLSWVRLPELYALRVFNDPTEENISFEEDDECGLRAKILAPTAPFRHLSVIDNDEEGILEIIQDSTDPARLFRHKVCVSSQSSQLGDYFYYEGCRNLIFNTEKRGRYYDSNLEVDLNCNYGKIIFSLIEREDLSNLPISKLLCVWHEISRTKERLDKAAGNEKEKYRLISYLHQLINEVKAEWVNNSQYGNFPSFNSLNSEQSLKMMEEIFIKAFPGLELMIKAPLSGEYFKKYAHRRFLVVISFEILNRNEIKLVNIKMGVPEMVPGTPQRCFSFYREILGDFNQSAYAPGREYQWCYLNNLVLEPNFWEDIKELVKGFSFYIVELCEKKNAVVAAFDSYKSQQKIA